MHVITPATIVSPEGHAPHQCERLRTSTALLLQPCTPERARLHCAGVFPGGGRAGALPQPQSDDAAALARLAEPLSTGLPPPGVLAMAVPQRPQVARTADVPPPLRGCAAGGAAAQRPVAASAAAAAQAHTPERCGGRRGEEAAHAATRPSADRGDIKRIRLSSDLPASPDLPRPVSAQAGPTADVDLPGVLFGLHADPSYSLLWVPAVTGRLARS